MLAQHSNSLLSTPPFTFSISQKKNFAHNGRSINCFEWMAEETVCARHPHTSISKHWTNSRDIQSHFRSYVSPLFSSSGYLGFCVCKWRGWLWKFHVLPHCTVLLRTRADRKKKKTRFTRKTCAACEGHLKTETTASFPPRTELKSAHLAGQQGCLHAHSSVKIQLDTCQMGGMSRCNQVLGRLCCLPGLKADMENEPSTCLYRHALSSQFYTSRSSGIQDQERVEGRPLPQGHVGKRRPSGPWNSAPLLHRYSIYSCVETR